MNPFAMISIITEAMRVIPQVVAAIQQIMASDAAHTVESAIQEIIAHLTPGGPAAQALSPHASPLVPTAAETAATTTQAIDFQAPRG